jgi:NTP pyrophosphatase (non-canonical NTP hydrolase)
MSLIEVFQDIKKYHKALGYDYTNATIDEKMQHLRNNALALHQELAELVDGTPWKPWRSLGSQTFDLDNIAEEIIDCIFFLGAISEIFEISSEELDEAFDNVLAKNYGRVESGYNNDPSKRR